MPVHFLLESFPDSLLPVTTREQVLALAYQEPVFSIDAQGSVGGSGSPFWRISIEMPSGERINAM